MTGKMQKNSTIKTNGFSKMLVITKVNIIDVLEKTVHENSTIAELEGVSETLKADNQMEWVGQMNNIRSRATEIVNNDIIYT